MPTPTETDVRWVIDQSEERLFERFQSLGVTEAQLEHLHESDYAEKYGNWLADGDG